MPKSKRNQKNGSRAPFKTLLAVAALLLMVGNAEAQRLGRDRQKRFGKTPSAKIVKSPDLIIQNISRGKAAYEKDFLIVPLTLTIRNNGAATRTAFTVRGNITAKVKLTPGQLLVKGSPVRIAGIGKEANSTLKGEFRIHDWGRLSGQRIGINFQVDPDNAVAESNERNNGKYLILDVRVKQTNPATPTTLVGVDSGNRNPGLRPTRPSNLKNPFGGRRPGIGSGGFGVVVGRPTVTPGATGRPSKFGSKQPKPGGGSPGGGAPGGVLGNQQIRSFYRSNDGGAWYVRKVQNNIYMFGEHPGRHYATVYEGTVSGSNVSGKYWDLPKGSRTLRGNLNLSIQANGDRLVAGSKSGGIDLSTLESYPLSNVQLPTSLRRPGFYATTAGDLDGAWRSGNNSLYIREVDDRIIGWEEQHFSGGQKPGVARVLIGHRAGSGNAVLDYVGLPKGHSTITGDAAFVVEDAFHIRQLGGSKWVRDVVDFDKFGDEVINRLKNKCTGFGFAIAHEGQIVESGGWGNRTLSGDGVPLLFTADTQKDTQSTAKTITAAAVLHLLHKKGKSIDEKINNYLPVIWQRGPNVQLLTFRHLLTHRSALTDVGDPDEYENLKQTIANGAPDMNWISPAFNYQNSNFAMFRIIIPYLDNLSDMHNFEDNGVSGVTLNERCSTRYLNYVRDNVLLPAGLSNPHAGYSSTNRAYSYNFLQQNVAGYPQQDGQLYEMGAGSWIVSAKDYAKFLAALENGVILSKSKLAEMKSQRLGLFKAHATTPVGSVYYHNGAIGGGSNGAYGSGRGARAFATMFANNVQAYITVNSANNQEPAETLGAKALIDAFNASMH